jgi:hypothetical protein
MRCANSAVTSFDFVKQQHDDQNTSVDTSNIADRAAMCAAAATTAAHRQTTLDPTIISFISRVSAAVHLLNNTDIRSSRPRADK